MDEPEGKGAARGGETALYRWFQAKDEIVMRIKPPISGSLSLGTKVMVHGLKKTPKYNWKDAVVVRGLKDERYRVQMTDSLKEVNVRPKNLCVKHERDSINVRFKSKEISIAVNGSNIVQGVLKHIIVTDECTWYMASGLPEILLTKQEHEWWSGVIEGDAEIDVALMEGETFLDEKILDKLKTRRAREKTEDMLRSKKLVPLEELQEYYSSKIKREESDFATIKRDQRAFALWTRNAREIAGLPLGYSSLGSVCSPIRCIEQAPKCSLRTRVDSDTMDRIREEAYKEVDASHQRRLQGLRRRLEISKSVTPLSTYVCQTAVLPAACAEVWKLVMPISHVAAPCRLVLSSCRRNHGVGKTFKIKTKAKITER